MTKTALPKQDNQNDDWASRGDYWHGVDADTKRRTAKQRFVHEPLILSGHGVRLRVDRGTLMVCGGFTHYPQQQGEWRFFPKDRHLPSRIVIIDGDGGISFDALEWLATQGVPLVQINWKGDVISVGGGYGYAANPEIYRAQLDIQESAYSFEFAKHLIQQKIETSIMVLENVFSSGLNSTKLKFQGNRNHAKNTEATCDDNLISAKLQNKIQELKNSKCHTISDLLGIEGSAAALYFRCWHSLPLKWKGTGKKPIPKDWLHIGPRMADEKRNQFATHPVNAMLNYAYAMLQHQVQGIILAAGFDPTIGTIHKDDTGNKPKFVFDLMEPLRPLIDQKILNFVTVQTFSPHDFVINQTGVCKLHPQFSKIIIGLICDIPDIENITINNLKKFLALHPQLSRKATKNVATYKAKLVGKRE